mmetsp:Transcript_8981/g.18333  ORF Transcript_8981/g.18333 Transcript_8981/m.18333 type:complete len:156 (-) Transcript_8981:3821-4288(-)
MSLSASRQLMHLKRISKRSFHKKKSSQKDASGLESPWQRGKNEIEEVEAEARADSKANEMKQLQEEDRDAPEDTSIAVDGDEKIAQDEQEAMVLEKETVMAEAPSDKRTFVVAPSDNVVVAPSADVESNSMLSTILTKMFDEEGFMRCCLTDYTA